MRASNPAIEGKGLETRREIESVARSSLWWQHFSRSKSGAEKRHAASRFDAKFEEKVPINRQLWRIRRLIKPCRPSSHFG
jgi:hypothetical protein